MSLVISLCYKIATFDKIYPAITAVKSPVTSIPVRFKNAHHYICFSGRAGNVSVKIVGIGGRTVFRRSRVRFTAS
jgi:hypothetical protein